VASTLDYALRRTSHPGRNRNHDEEALPMKILSVLAVALGLSLASGAASAQTCPSACGLQAKACLQTARVTKLACKMDCRTNTPATGLGACMRACTDTFRSSKDACRGGLGDCVGSCTPPSPALAGCVGACGQALAECARGVVSDAKACVQGCRTAPDRLACLQGCADAARQGAGTCATGFAACLTACGVTPPPTPCLLSGPACGGGCPDGLVCQSTAGRFILVPCFCRPSSPSGAFLD
jgi:hypothetical protein